MAERSNEQRHVDPEKRYPHNAIGAFDAGAMLDLRVRIALNVLTNSPAAASFVSALTVGIDCSLKPEEANKVATSAARYAARFALEAASELLGLADERGLIEPIPPAGDELDQTLADYAKRQGQFGVEQQVEGAMYGQKKQAELQREGGLRIAVVGPGMAPHASGHR